MKGMNQRWRFLHGRGGAVGVYSQGGDEPKVEDFTRKGGGRLEECILKEGMGRND